MDDIRQCQHESGGGVNTNFDSYGTRKKLGLPVNNWQHICWPCWEEWGRDIDQQARAETDAAPRAQGLCGFLEAWIGHCLETAPCGKHQSKQCWECKAPATRNCAHTGSFVCGTPECAEHSHTHGG